MSEDQTLSRKQEQQELNIYLGKKIHSDLGKCIPIIKSNNYKMFNMDIVGPKIKKIVVDAYNSIGTTFEKLEEDISRLKETDTNLIINYNRKFLQAENIIRRDIQILRNKL